MTPPSAGTVEVWKRVIVERLCSEQKSSGFLTAIAAQDFVAMAVVAFFDNPNKQRLVALLQQSDGIDIVSEVCWNVLVESPEGTLTKTINEVICEQGAVLKLSTERIEVLEGHWATSDAADESAGVKLRWLAAQDSECAVELAIGATEAAAPGPLGPRDSVAVRVLIESNEAAAHAAVLRLASRNATAAQLAIIDEVVSGLTPHTGAKAALTALCSSFSAAGWAPTGHLLSCLTERCDPGTAIEIACSQPLAWAAQHLLPQLVEHHGDVILERFAVTGWSEGHRSWLISSAAWSDDQLTQLLRAIQTARPLDSAGLAGVYDRVFDRISQTVGAEPRKTAYPAVGLRLLVTEALDGKLEPTDTRLCVLARFEPAVRQRLYASTSWRSPDRAARLAAVVGFVCVADVLHLMPDARRLSATARSEFFKAVAPFISEAVAATIAGDFASDTIALTALVQSTVGASAVLARWVSHAEITCFESLENTEHSKGRLQPIAGLVRDYKNDLTFAEREKLLNAFVASHDQANDLLVSIVDDWDSAQRAPDALLKLALSHLTDRPLESTLSARLLADVRALCENHTDDEVRSLAYGSLPEWPSDATTVELLSRRRETEPSIGHAVVAACARVATDLLNMVAVTEGEERRISLTLLAKIEPASALPIARDLATSAPLPDDRILGIEIVGAHGGGDSDASALEQISKSHPNDRVRHAATLEWRRITVGDLIGAHNRLGQLADKDPSRWNHLDPLKLYGQWGEMLRAGLDRVARDESAGSFGSAIDQLGAEVAKVVLYRLLEVDGHSVTHLKATVVASAVNNSADYGVVVRNVQIQQAWPSVISLISLYEMRTEHVAPKGTTTPFAVPGPDDWIAARSLFRRGVGPLLELLTLHV